MPISAIDGLPASHWLEVREVLSDAIRGAGFEPRLVSESADIGVIHKRIVQNLYENPVIVCDVSARNPNVMTELGMRLAFDKPTLIVKDDATRYSFDTQIIEHVTYPRDLRFKQVVQFKNELTKRVGATRKQALRDPDFSPFLKHFGTFKVAKLDTVEVSHDALLREELREIKEMLSYTVAGSDVRSGSSDRASRVPSSVPTRYDALVDALRRTVISLVADGADLTGEDAERLVWDAFRSRGGCWDSDRAVVQPMIQHAIQGFSKGHPDNEAGRYARG